MAKDRYPSYCPGSYLPTLTIQQKMAVVTQLATININGTTNRTRVGMRTDYIRRHGLDVVFLQEVIDPEMFHMPGGYEVYYNIGSYTRGTAIVARSDIMLTNINKIPSGRAIAAEYNGWHIINIYAPSGTAKRAEREQFYNVDVPQLIQTGHGDLIIGVFSTV
jgi:exonuclease III